MKITFLGTSHGFAEAHKFCSSVAVTTGGKHYIIDAGAPLAGLLPTYGMSPYDIAGIFITHNHGDHVNGMMEFVHKMEMFPRFNKGVRIPVYIPEEARFLHMMNYLFGEEKFRQHRLLFEVYQPGVVFEDEHVKITAIPVQHMAVSYAFLLEAEGKRVLFTGDLKAGMPDFPAAAFEADNDLVVTEGAHTILNKPEVMEKLENVRTKLFAVTHRADFFNTDEIMASFTRRMADRYPVYLPQDGDVLIV